MSGLDRLHSSALCGTLILGDTGSPDALALTERSEAQLAPFQPRVNGVQRLKVPSVTLVMIHSLGHCSAGPQSPRYVA
jgi:hypothetical protein